jgi:hypothetical protein
MRKNEGRHTTPQRRNYATDTERGRTSTHTTSYDFNTNFQNHECHTMAIGGRCYVRSVSNLAAQCIGSVAAAAATTSALRKVLATQARPLAPHTANA